MRAGTGAEVGFVHAWGGADEVSLTMVDLEHRAFYRLPLPADRSDDEILRDLKIRGTAACRPEHMG